MIDEKKLIDKIANDFPLETLNKNDEMLICDIIDIIENQPKVGEWIPITYHETTDNDGIDKEQFPLMLDCVLPEDDTEIIVCAKNGSVFSDKFFNDDGCYLESGFDIIEDIIAWMPLPEPYKGSER